MLLDIYNYFFGDDKPKEYKERFKFLVTVSKYELIESSLPVFVAAGVSGSAVAIIDVLSEDDENAKIVLVALYALFAYFVGKLFTYILLRDEERPSSKFPFSVLRQYKFSKLFRHSLSELSGFAWKEFFIIFCLEEIFLKEGLGPTFGSWLLIGGVAVVAVIISSHVQRGIFRFSHTWNQKILSYDTEAFALSLAYILTAVVSLACWKGGVALIPSNSILFEWHEGFEEHHDSGVQLVVLYSFVVACLVAVAQYPESEESATIRDELCEVRQSTTVPTLPSSALQQAAASGGETVNPIANNGSHSSFELDNSSGGLSSMGIPHHSAPPTANSATLCGRILDNDSVATLMVLWNEFLG
jgi:hypothetical protein